MPYTSNRIHTLKQQLNSSFFSGVGSLLNIRGGYKTYRPSSAASDIDAIAGDWKRVGDQILQAASRVNNSNSHL